MFNFSGCGLDGLGGYEVESAVDVLDAVFVEETPGATLRLTFDLGEVVEVRVKGFGVHGDDDDYDDEVGLMRWELVRERASEVQGQL